MSHGRIVAGLGAMLALTPLTNACAEVVRSASGADAASIGAALGAFRTDLGTLNANTPGSVGSGRREINWDAVPDTLAAPNLLPANFFNAAVSPRARGVVFSTPGSGFAVSADDTNPTNNPRDFAEIDPTYADQFEQFSPQRLFTALGSNVTDVNFFIPGEDTPGLTRGFGVIFSDVDLAGGARLELYGIGGNLLYAGDALAAPGAQTFSFLGVSFDTAVVARARIFSGTTALGAGVLDAPNLGVDLVVMDDFIYGEPVAVPEPGSLLLLTLGAVGSLFRRR